MRRSCGFESINIADGGDRADRGNGGDAAGGGNVGTESRRGKKGNRAASGDANDCFCLKPDELRYECNVGVSARVGEFLPEA